MKKKIFLLFAIISIALLATGCGSKVKPVYDKSGNPVYISDSEYSKMYTNPNTYKGKFVKLKGRIFTDPEKNEEYMGFQMWGDSEKVEKNTIVYYTDDISLKSDDYVLVEGYIYGEYEGTNAFGGSVIAPVIIATKVTKSDYKTVVRPTLEEKEYTDKVINQHGCIISINKVEFAEKETRVYVSAENQSGSDFSIFTYSAKIIQGSKQFDEDGNYDADYQELQNELKPGVKSEGIIVFPALEKGDYKIILDGYSDNWNIDINEYIFELTY